MEKGEAFYLVLILVDHKKKMYKNSTFLVGTYIIVYVHVLDNL